MKLIYQGKEVGITNKEADTAIELFGESIAASPDKIIACRCNNEIRPLDYQFEEEFTYQTAKFPFGIGRGHPHLFTR